MNEFKEIRERVDIKAIAGLYGLEVNRSGMCCCPFHTEKTPSMKLYEKDNKFYCFGCGKSGDGIDLCSALTGLPHKEAAKQICGAFGLDDLYNNDKQINKSSVNAETAKRQVEIAEKKAEEQWLKSAFIVVGEYHKILSKWETTHRPTAGKEPDELFVEVLTQKSSVDYLLDEFQGNGHEIYEYSRKAVENIAYRLREIRQKGLDKIKPIQQEKNIGHKNVSHGHTHRK